LPGRDKTSKVSIPNLRFSTDNDDDCIEEEDEDEEEEAEKVENNFQIAAKVEENRTPAKKQETSGESNPPKIKIL
jgi:hypothetical protein